jgi:Fe(3+) dicitrate transport protein
VAALHTLIFFLSTLVSFNLFSQQAPESIENITIVGKRIIHGSATTINAATLSQFETTDIHKALSAVPGVSFRPEEGYGLRPNISIRGTYSDRSGKITLMEDGILIAPAPYAAPAAYYFPTFGRINSVEILKGPSAITTGPYTIGGAINLLSTPIPDVSHGFINLELGSDGAQRTHATYGSSSENMGFLIESHQADADGFDKIEHMGGPTGFNKDDFLIKLRVNSDRNKTVYHQLDIKLQDSTETSNQSYVGLSYDDYINNPYRRYGLTAYDKMNNDHDQFVISYSLDAGNFNFNATTYENNFHRDWFKTEKIGYSGVDRGINDLIGYANDSDAKAIGILRGTNTAAENITIKHNNRSYTSTGTVLRLIHSTDRSTLTVGYRNTKDNEDRFQWNDSALWAQGNLGEIISGLKPGYSSDNSDTVSEASAFFINDDLRLGNVTLSLGLRTERWQTIQERYTDEIRTEVNVSGGYPKILADDKETVYGLGIGYNLQNGYEIFGGFHQGFTPSTGSTSNPESANNLEIGIRYSGLDINYEAIYFNTDYKNMFGTCTNASSGVYNGCTLGDTFDGGAATISGLEFSASTSFINRHGVTFPLTANLTTTNSTFDTTFTSTYWGEVSKGMKIPNTLDSSLSIAVGAEARSGWSSYIKITNYGGTCSIAACLPNTEIESYSMIDLSISKSLNGSADFYFIIDNLSDSSDIVARAPKNGIRTQRPRSFSTGLRYNF